MALLLSVSFASVIFVLFFIAIGYWKRCALPVIFGLASVLPGLWPSKAIQAGTYRAILKIDSEPYYGRNEEVSFTALVVSNGAESKGHRSLAPATRLRCRSPMLPWRNSAALRSGIQVGALISITPIKEGPPWSRGAQLRRSGILGYCKVQLITKPLMEMPSSLQQKLIETIRGRVGDSESFSLVLGMTIGLRGAISRKTERAFRVLSLSHLLVVSGYHFGVVFSVLTALFRLPRHLFPAQHWLAVECCFRFVALVALVFYCELVGGGLSSTRALLAAAVAYVALTSERGVSFFNSILFAALVLCAVYPGSLYTIGTQYTFAALTGIGIALTGSNSYWRRVVTVPLFATLASSIVTLLWFQSFSLLGVVANILLAPVLSILIITPGLVALLLLAIYEPLAVLLLEFAASLAAYLKDLVCSIATLPGVEMELSIFASFSLLSFLSFLLCRVSLIKLRQYLQWRAVFPYTSIYAMQRTFIDL